MRYFFIILFLLPLSSLHAEEIQEPALLPFGLPELPSASSDQPLFYLSFQNEHAFRELLFAPFSRLITTHKFQAVLQSEIIYPFSIGKSFSANENFSSDNTSTSLGLTKPHGDFVTINREIDLGDKAIKILENIEYLLTPVGELQYEQKIRWFDASNLLREASSRLIISGNTNQSQYLKEYLLEFTAPTALYSHTYVLQRFLDSQKDKLCIYSPILQRPRCVPSANKADAIFIEPLTLEDVYIWIENPTLVTARVVADTYKLVPFADKKEYSIAEIKTTSNVGEQEKEISSAYTIEGLLNFLERTGEQKQTTTLWNHQSAAFGMVPQWNPTSWVFVPRRVWIIEIYPKDIYASYGKIILVVDQESNLPIYKMVFDQKNIFQKMIIASWGKASVHGSNPAQAFLSGLLIATTNDQFLTVTTDRVRFFDSMNHAYQEDFERIRKRVFVEETEEVEDANKN